MTVHTDELLERKWRELGNVPIDYTPDEPDGVLGSQAHGDAKQGVNRADQADGLKPYRQQGARRRPC